MALPFSAITPIPNDGPDATPSLWNDRYLQIDDNFEFLQDGLSAAFEDIADLDARITAVEVAGPASVSSAVQSDWHYRANKTAVELWSTYWTLLDPIGAHTVPAGVSAGAYQIDVNTTVGLHLGYEYILSGGANQELIVISQILSGTRILVMAGLQYSYPAGATIRRTDFTVDGVNSKATAYDNNVYFCGPISLGSGPLKSCVIKRNADSVSTLLMYFKDNAHTSWTAALWSLRRTMADGTIEIEHVFPADSSGNIQIKFLCDTIAPENHAEIYGFIFLSEYSGLGGTPRTSEILNEIAAAKAIANNSITLPMLTDIATASLLGRNSAGTGDPEVLPSNTVKTMLGLGTAAYTASTAYAPAAHVGAGGAAHANAVAGGAAGFMTGADKTKLNAVGTMANRAVFISTAEPTSGDGADGDVWLQYI
jgi:hypothetical protein